MAVSTVKLNGVTLMTVNDTTAAAGDVAGKYFYAADGTKTLGTYSPAALLDRLVWYNCDEHLTLTENPSGTNPARIGVDRDHITTILTCSNPQTTYATRIKVSGELDRSVTSSAVQSWGAGITLLTGHTYRATLYHVGGTATMINDNSPPSVSVYVQGASSSLGTHVWDGDTSIRTFTVSSGQENVNVCVYVYAGTTLVNARYIVILEDITA